MTHGKLLAKAAVDRAEVDAALDEAAFENVSVGARALVVLYGQVESIVSLFVSAQMMSSALQKDPELFAARRLRSPF